MRTKALRGRVYLGSLKAVRVGERQESVFLSSSRAPASAPFIPSDIPHDANYAPWRLDAHISRYVGYIAPSLICNGKNLQGDEGRSSTGVPQHRRQHPDSEPGWHTASGSFFDSTIRCAGGTNTEGRGRICETISSDSGVHILPSAKGLSASVCVEGGRRQQSPGDTVCRLNKKWS